MTGAQNFIEIHADEPSAVRSFGANHARRSRPPPAPTITLDGDLLAVMEALYQEVTAKRELERSFEDMVQRDPAPDRADGRRRAAHLPGREPVPQHREIRERQARGATLQEDSNEAK